MRFAIIFEFLWTGTRLKWGGEMECMDWVSSSLEIQPSNQLPWTRHSHIAYLEERHNELIVRWYVETLMWSSFSKFWILWWRRVVAICWISRFEFPQKLNIWTTKLKKFNTVIVSCFLHRSLWGKKKNQNEWIGTSKIQNIFPIRGIIDFENFFEMHQ